MFHTLSNTLLLYGCEICLSGQEVSYRIYFGRGEVSGRDKSFGERQVGQYAVMICCVRISRLLLALGALSLRTAAGEGFPPKPERHVENLVMRPAEPAMTVQVPRARHELAEEAVMESQPQRYYRPSNIWTGGRVRLPFGNSSYNGGGYNYGQYTFGYTV